MTSQKVYCWSRGVNPGGDASPPINFEGGMRGGCIPPIIYRSYPPIIYRTLQNCFPYPAKIVKLSQRKIMTEKSESISMKTFFFFFLFCFGDHLISGRKNVRISDFGRRMWLNFDEDLFFFFFFFFLGDHLFLGWNNECIPEVSEKLYVQLLMVLFHPPQ